jgi:hypothetical protein
MCSLAYVAPLDSRDGLEVALFRRLRFLGRDFTSKSTNLIHVILLGHANGEELILYEGIIVVDGNPRLEVR